jgi:hypothetical protein
MSLFTWCKVLSPPAKHALICAFGADSKNQPAAGNGCPHVVRHTCNNLASVANRWVQG